MWLLVFVICVSLGGSINAGDPIVKTKYGIFQGTWGLNVRNASIANFRGIPYAAPPIGALRFKAPREWKTKLDGPAFAVDFMQPCYGDDFFAGGSEDCLYLNVFTPGTAIDDEMIRGKIAENTEKNETAKERFPVMVYLVDNVILGSNVSLYTPEYILTQNVILVTVTYRRGVFGYFTTGDKAAPGNYGLKDVVAALKWIQENIAAFGGDPDAVTLAGQSSAASVVQLLVISDKTEGLFHRYVTQSGSAISPWAYRDRETAKSASLDLAEELGCTNGSTSSEIMDCLRDVDVTEILNATVHGYSDNWNTVFWWLYGPTDEPKSDEAIITKDPEISVLEREIRDIPWLTGVVADEGSIMLNFLNAAATENFTLCDSPMESVEMFVDLFNYQDIVEDKNKFVEALASFYFEANGTKEDCEDSISQMLGDAYVNWPLYEALKFRIFPNASSVFLYNFAYRGAFNTSHVIGNAERDGISHTDDLNYLFPVLNSLNNKSKLMKNTDDATMVNVITEMWTSFVIRGYPRAFVSPKWDAYQKDGGFMEFRKSSDYSMNHGFLTDRMEFWRGVWKNFFKPSSAEITNVKKHHNPLMSSGFSTSPHIICPSLLALSISTLYL